MSPPWLPTTPWLPVTAPITGGTTSRSAAITESVVRQWAVETSPRYRPRPAIGGGADTYCNIFVCDVTTALGCAVPRWWQLGPRLEHLTANRQHDWLKRIGSEHGWSIPSEPLAAQRAVDAGRVAVAVWTNPNAGHSGHIAVVVPSRGEAGVWIAQAGARCFERAKLEAGFGSDKTPQFFIHL
jgi:hypothetical protein